MFPRNFCDLSIIIVNYNTRDYLVRCIDSIMEQAGIETEIIVVDNNSTDLSTEILKQRFPEVKMIANAENAGFSRANNQAVAISGGRYLYFLNPDTEVYPGSLQAMIYYMDTHPDIGLAGTRMVNPDDTPQESVEYRYPGQKYARNELKDLKGDIAWVLGASMIVRRDAWVNVGGFDEDFFLYGEEQDLCLRLRKAGWRVGYVPDASVLHWGGKSERNHLPAEIWAKKFQAELTFYRKHYSINAIRRIGIENILQAVWRIASLRLTILFCQAKDIYRMKLKKYQAVLRIFGKNTFFH